MASGQPPELDADGHLDGKQGEVLLFLPGLELDEHLVELKHGKERERERRVTGEQLNKKLG